VNTTREGFRIAHDIRCIRWGVSRAAAPLIDGRRRHRDLTYYGAEKVVPRYNVMGVAKAALEASVRYLANDLGRRDSRQRYFGRTDQNACRSWHLQPRRHAQSSCDRAPLKRNVDPAEVGGTAAFLLSSAGSGITGETIYVDCGYNIMAFEKHSAIITVHDQKTHHCH